MVGDVRAVKMLGMLGCQIHLRPYVIWEIEPHVDGASRRFVFMCPEIGCGLGVRVTSRATASVKIVNPPNPDMAGAQVAHEVDAEPALAHFAPCPTCNGVGTIGPEG